MTRRYRSAEELADSIVDAVGKNIVLGLPVGIGKATHVADALFARAAADSSVSLTIFTGLTLELPQARSDLEKRFLQPISERLYGNWQAPEYARSIRNRRLPTNVEVREFYLRPGAWLGNPVAQQNYTSINYSQVADELLDLGVNVIAQLVACRTQAPGKYSLSSNPEITLDLLGKLRERRRQGTPFVMAGQVNRELPYMTGDAELDGSDFDFILDDRRYAFPLFGLPNRRVSAADYATAMHVTSLVPDGGTLQIGIGSLSDAVAHCLRLRHENPDVFADVLGRLPGGSRAPRRRILPIETKPFEAGLYSSTELLSDALFSLFERGIVKRAADDEDGAYIHAGFFIGSGKLYTALRELDEERQNRIEMTRISFTNTLFGDEKRKRLQRRQGRFINETMMVTLLGAAVSDSLADGRVVSGVGGQFDFVAMAHALEDARSILMVRARRMHEGVAKSNIRWSYAEATVPRHHRDVFVSEYGVAATRGQTDRQVIHSMLCIADSDFQPALMKTAKRAGKLAPDYGIADEASRNTPAALCTIFEDEDIRRYFPPYPLGTDLTPTEQALAVALTWLDHRMAKPLSAARTVAAALLHGGSKNHVKALERLGLQRASGMRERVSRRLVGYALSRQ